MRDHRASRLLVLLLLLGFSGWACGDDAPPTPPTTPPETPSPTPVAGNVSALEVHEWGLIDVRPGRPARLAAGPRPVLPPVVPAASRAPLLYFHLPGDSGPVDVSIRVRLFGGNVTERWPLAQVESDGVSWSAVVRPGNCTATRRAVAGQPPCGAEPGCEALELSRYETADGACVRVGNDDFDHLFYTGNVPFELPLQIERAGRGFRVRNDAVDLPGAVFVVHRDGDGTAARVHGEPIPRGETVAMEAGEPYDDGARTVFTAPMRGLGLTDEERAAFERAWSDALFGPAAGQPRDALLFWLPEARVQSIAALEIMPAPPPSHVRRCFLVRVDLDGI